MSAEEFKAQGNAAFSAKEYEKAAELFTKAIEASETPNHVLYSNRSGAYAAMKKYDSALEDALQTTKINPQWAKGYSRLGAAHHGLGDLVSAKDAYEQALKVDPANAQAKAGLQSVEDAISREAAADGQMPDMGFSQMFKDPQTMAKLYENPKTREYLKDPDFQQKIQAMASNPMAALQSATQDPRLMEAMGVLLGIDMQASPANAGENDTFMPDAPAEEKPKPKAEPKKEPEPDLPSEKVEADKEKAQGNDLYKKRQFDEAIEHYNKAWSLFKDITYLNNRAAAEFEKGDYETTIKTCQQAVDEGHEMHADFKLIARALGRIGSCYLKLDNLNEAIKYFEKSLTEHRSPDVLTKLRDTQRELRKREEEAYIDPVKAEEARNEGNELFKKAQFPESVKAYTEAIKRAPEDPRGYGNRAASYLKLMSYPEAVSDCDKAISLDPKFFKAYTRKATALNIMKQYRKSMEVLDQAREVDTEGKHTREIDELENRAYEGRFASLPGESETARAERLAQDPEIDEIRRDPVMNTILQQAANDPAALNNHMRNPEVRRKIRLLAAAGIIRTR